MKVVIESKNGGLCTIAEMQMHELYQQTDIPSTYGVRIGDQYLQLTITGLYIHPVAKCGSGKYMRRVEGYISVHVD